MLEVRYSSRFKKHFKDYRYNLKLVSKLEKFFNQIIFGKLDKSWNDHQLSGVFSDYREVHLFPNILLIYKISGNICLLVDIGSHSDLFG